MLKLLAFESVDEIFNCDHSYESFRPVLYCQQCCFFPTEIWDFFSFELWAMLIWRQLRSLLWSDWRILLKLCLFVMHTITRINSFQVYMSCGIYSVVCRLGESSALFSGFLIDVPISVLLWWKKTGNCLSHAFLAWSQEDKSGIFA